MASHGTNLIERELHENFALALAPLPQGQKRVDRDKKVLFGVKLLGLHSGNRHEVEGVTGTDYDPQAIRNALPLYEGLPAYCDHPPRRKPGEPVQDRSIRDGIGMHRNVRQAPDGCMVSDLHLLPHHNLTESILDSAENDNLAGLFACSHHAYGKGEVRGQRYVVTNLDQAFSGDVVAKGSTTRNLFESAEPTMPDNTQKPAKTTLGKIVLESALPATGTGLTKALLLEMGDMMGAEVSTEGDHKDDLVSAIGKLVKSTSPEDHAMAAKILKMLKPDCKAEGEEKKPDEKVMKESQESKDLSTKILTAVGLKAEGPLLEAMNLTPSIDGKLAMLTQIKAAAAALVPEAKKPGNKQPPGAPRVDASGKVITESAQPKTDDLLGVCLN